MGGIIGCVSSGVSTESAGANAENDTSEKCDT